MVEILAALTGDLKAWGGLLFTFAYLVGMGMVVVGFAGLVGTSATQKGVMQGVPIPALLKMIVVGCLMLVIHDVLNVGSQTVFSTDARQMLDYNPVNNGGLSATYNAILAFAYNVAWFLGLYSFLRGMMVLGSIDRQGQHGLKDAGVFLGAGIALINLDDTVRIFAASVAAAGNETALNISQSILNFIPQ